MTTRKLAEKFAPQDKRNPFSKRISFFLQLLFSKRPWYTVYIKSQYGEFL